MIPCISDIARAGYGIRKAQASVDRINTVLNIAEKDLQVSTKAENVKSNKTVSNHIIEFKGVSYKYGINLPDAVSDVSLSINKGSKVAIIGHTGSGKSTLAKLLPRFFEPSKGSIHIEGDDISLMDLSVLRDGISYVSQDAMLFNDTIYNNIVFGNPDAQKDEVEQVAKNIGLHDFIMSLPLAYETPLGDRGACLSGGQKQCVAIARALLKNAPIIILDEATSALDFETEQKVMAAIDSIKGLTQIIITHRLSSIKNCDQVFVMKNGEITECGSPSELMKSGGYLEIAINI